MFATAYLRCPECHVIFADPDGKLSAVETPAPCCGARGDPRRIWPGRQALKLLEVVENQDVANPDEHRIALLFFASALELMLEAVLVELVRQHTTSDALSEAILDSYQGVERRRSLFSRLSGTSIGGVLSDEWGQEFLRDWKALATRRNKVAHGAYYYADSNDLLLMQRMRGSYLRAFVEMHNHVTRWASSAVVR